MEAVTTTFGTREAIETARERAHATLAALEREKAESERRLASTGAIDLMARVTGRSSIDNAIAATRRMMESLDRQLSASGRSGPRRAVVTVRERTPAFERMPLR